MSAKRRQEAIARFSVPLAVTPRAETLEEAPGPRRASRKSNDIDAADFVISDNDHSEDEDFTTTRKNGKGKAKQTQADSDFEDDVSFGATQGLNNPAVMLISLKAVCWFGIVLAYHWSFAIQGSLGLNLTGKYVIPFLPECEFLLIFNSGEQCISVRISNFVCIFSRWPNSSSEWTRTRRFYI